MKYIHDMAHCKADTCKRRNECYRYNAYQEVTKYTEQEKPEIFTISVLMVKDTDKCTHFMFDDNTVTGMFKKMDYETRIKRR